MKIAYVLYFCVLLLFTACFYSTSIPKTAIDKQLDSVAKTSMRNDSAITHFSVCHIIPNRDWDSIMVIGPYSNEASFKNVAIANFDAVKDTLLSVSFNEGKCILAYIKNKNVISYSIVNRMPIDFNMGYKDINMIKKTECSLMGLKKRNTGELTVQRGMKN